MFTWDDSTPTTLSASPTNQLKVSGGVRAATLRTIELSAKSSRWTSPDCQGCWACLLFVVQRSSVRGEGGVVVLDELLEEVLDEV